LYPDGAGRVIVEDVAVQGPAAEELAGAEVVVDGVNNERHAQKQGQARR
jgi:hypothetical protein